MKNKAREDRAEPRAKAALLNFLRTRKSLSKKSAVSTELIIDKHAVRADVVLCDANSLRCYEIKTEKDTLSRLPKQLDSYLRHTDYVTVVAATKHINAVLSRVPPYVGIYELTSFSGSVEVRVVREAAGSPLTDATAMLSLLPASHLRDTFKLGAGIRRRADILVQAATESDATKRAAVLEFIRFRYQPNTIALLDAAHRRPIRPADLTMLRRWARGRGEAAPPEAILTSTVDDGETRRDGEIYRFVGRSFGPVPDEVRAMLTN